MTTLVAGGAELAEPIRSADDIIAHIARQSKSPADYRIGMEYERLGVYRKTGKAIPFKGGVESILDRVADTGGWTRGFENGRIVYLQKEGEFVTLEPGGQTEFTSRPAKTIAELLSSAQAFQSVLDSAADEIGAVYLGIGFHPFSRIEDIEWVPKRRYDFMKPYLARTGTLGHEMMTLTAGAQIALDYGSPEDAMRKVRAAALLTPIAQAIFASSGIVSGEPGGMACRRGWIWTDTDPARCGIPPFMLREGSTLGDYVDWIVKTPLMFVERSGRYDNSGGRTLGDLIAQGSATLYDAELALTQAFPEVRLKRFVEVRSIDAPQPRLQATAACFWSSLLYGDLDAVFDLLGGLTTPQWNEMRASAIDHGLQGRAAGRRMSEWALDALSIAHSSSTCDITLTHLRKRAEAGITAADAARNLLAKCGSPQSFVAEWNDFRWV